MLAFGAGCCISGSMVKLGRKFFSAIFTNLGSKAGCFRAGTVSGCGNKNLFTIGTDLVGGAGCGRAGNVFVAACGKGAKHKRRKNNKGNFFHNVLPL
jgi:hypothetical protein